MRTDIWHALAADGRDPPDRDWNPARLLNLMWNQRIGGYPNPVFITATGMIGMIALSGIATRNAILLAEFVHEQLKEGQSLRAALIRSGAV